jgi:hypothetical protein
MHSSALSLRIVTTTRRRAHFTVLRRHDWRRRRRRRRCRCRRVGSSQQPYAYFGCFRPDRSDGRIVEISGQDPRFIWFVGALSVSRYVPCPRACVRAGRSAPVMQWQCRCSRWIPIGSSGQQGEMGPVHLRTDAWMGCLIQTT